MQTIHTAQTQYQSQFGKFATSLLELGPPQSGQPGPQAADLIDNNLASGEKSGYKYTVTGNPAGYIISAVPVVTTPRAAAPFTRIRRCRSGRTTVPSRPPRKAPNSAINNSGQGYAAGPAREYAILLLCLAKPSPPFVAFR